GHSLVGGQGPGRGAEPRVVVRQGRRHRVGPGRRAARHAPGPQGRDRRSGASGRLRPGLPPAAERRPAGHVPAHAHLPAADGADERPVVPARAARPGARAEPDRDAAAHRRRRAPGHGGVGGELRPAPQRRGRRPAGRRVGGRPGGVAFDVDLPGARSEGAGGRPGGRRRGAGRRSGAGGRDLARPGRRRTPLRQGLRRREPHPPVGADGEGLRVQAGDRARDVGEGPGARRAVGPAAGRAVPGRQLPQAAVPPVDGDPLHRAGRGWLGLRRPQCHERDRARHRDVPPAV
ncbi:MAG: Probable (3R)-hydroxyacyl-CoA dehydratase HtdX, partial [uncultured Blastococcus sp.]